MYTFIGYMVITFDIGLWAILHAKDSKPHWRLAMFCVMFILSPIVAKWSGIV